MIWLWFFNTNFSILHSFDVGTRENTKVKLIIWTSKILYLLTGLILSVAKE